jgi:hypothetical protein
MNTLLSPLQVPSYLRKSSAPDAATPTRPVQEGYQTQPSSSMPAQGGVPPSPAWDAATQPQQPSLHNSSVAMAAAAAAAAATAAAAAASAAAAAARAQAQAGAPMTPQALLAASFTKTSAGAASGIAAGSQATGLTGRAGEVDAAAKAGTRPAVEPGTNHAAVPSSFSRPVTPSTGAAAAVVSSQSAAAPPAISFSSVASPPVPVTNAPVAKLLMAPGGAPGEQIMSMLGGEMHADHSAALPGYSVGKIIGEGGFCQVGGGWGGGTVECINRQQDKVCFARVLGPSGQDPIDGLYLAPFPHDNDCHWVDQRTCKNLH